MSLGCACHIMECQRRKHLVSVSIGVTEYICCHMCSCVLVSMCMIVFCPYMLLYVFAVMWASVHVHDGSVFVLIHV